MPVLQLCLLRRRIISWNVRVRVQHIEPSGRHIAVLKLHSRFSLGIVDVRHSSDANEPL